MKKLFTSIVFLFIIVACSAQIYEPEGLNMPGDWNGWTNPPTNNLALASSTQVLNGRVTKIKIGTTRWQTIFSAAASGGDVVGGTFGWLFTSGSSGNPWGNKWANVNVSMNTIQTYTKQGNNNNSITVTNGKWYTMNWKDQGYANTEAIFMETSALPADILTVTGPAQGTVNIPVTVNMTVTTVLCPEEIIYLRYTTDAWATSTALPVTFVGTDGSVVIPGKPDGTIVEYYAFSSTIPDISGDYDMQSIKINDNGGSNYSYLVGAPPISWANLQGPEAGSINPGETLDVFAQVFIAGATGQPTPAPGVQAWIGYNSTNTNPDTWTNWVAATYNAASGAYDEYKAVIGATLAPGTYYYASRFQLGAGAYVYGGYNSGYWDGVTNVSGILTVNGAAPTVTTAAVSAVTNFSANSGGTVIADGGSAVTSRGVCWSTSPDPTIDNDKTIDADGTGSFTSALALLSPGTTYHVRAYATNTIGTGYGSDIQFTTYFTVSFNVDMSTASGFIPGTDAVYLAGNFPGAEWNQPGSNANLLMSQIGTTFTYTLSLPLPAGNYEFKHFKNAGWGGGEWGDGNRIVTISGNTTLNNTWGGDINWANLELPASGTIDFGAAFEVTAQAYIANGITASAGATYNLNAWIGYSTSNTDPGSWTNWVPAPFFKQTFDNDEFKADLGAAITISGTYYYASRFQFGNGTYIYGGYNGGYWNGTTNLSGVLTINPPPTKTLNITVFLEGLCRPLPFSGLMQEAQNENILPQFGPGIADQIIIELHNSNASYDLAYGPYTVNLNTDGTLAINNIPGSITGSYYIVIKNRNHIETWSSIPVDFGIAGPVSYNFSTSVSQAYNNLPGNDPLKLIGSVYAINGGEALLDGIVDASDMSAVFNASKPPALAGYNNQDVNGDGIVDASDMSLIFNNSKPPTRQIQRP
jgi:hypothetical protein